MKPAPQHRFVGGVARHVASSAVMTTVTIPNGHTRAGLILSNFLDGRSYTKADICDLTGYSRSTVSTHMDTLLQSGLLIKTRGHVSTGGRPPIRVGLNPMAGVVLAIEITFNRANVAVVNLAGVIEVATTHELVADDGPEPILDLVLAESERLLASPRVAGIELFGIGISIPAPVNYEMGWPVSPPNIPSWHLFDIPAYVARVLDAPVWVDNDVNVLAVSEWTDYWPKVRDLVFVKVATGIGSAIISGGQLQRGARGSAGDIGHARVPLGAHSPREPADERDLESIACGPAIARGLEPNGFDIRSSKDLAALVDAGNPQVIAAVRQAGREIGEVLATVVNFLNPAVICIGGSASRASGPHMIDGIREVVLANAIALATEDLTIAAARGELTAGVRGAAMMVLNNVLAPAAITRRLEALA